MRYTKRKDFHQKWRRQYYNAKTYAGKQREQPRAAATKAKKKPQRRKKRANYRNAFNWKKYTNKIKRPQSVTVGDDWEQVIAIPFSKLEGIAVDNEPKAEDLYTCGHARKFNPAINRINTRNYQKLARCPETTFFSVTAVEDPIVQSLAQQDAAKVFVTDDVLAVLMTAARSVDPWDVMVKRIGDYLFIDKRDGSNFDFPRVSETAGEPPNDDNGKTYINAPEPLSREAALINQYFSQQVLEQGATGLEMDNPSPFADATDANVAEVAYKYRKFHLVDDEAENEQMDIVVRTQVDAVMIKNNGKTKKTMTVHAFHQFDPAGDQLNWKTSLDTQGGGVLASVLKDNGARLARVTARALLAENDSVTLGFVARTLPSKHLDHLVLGTQTHRTTTIANQLSVTGPTLWASASYIIDELLLLQEGQYVLMKDANEQTLRLYAVPDSYNGTNPNVAGPSA